MITNLDIRYDNIVLHGAHEGLPRHTVEMVIDVHRGRRPRRQSAAGAAVELKLEAANQTPSFVSLAQDFTN